jgi:hypothetical protein
LEQAEETYTSDVIIPRIIALLEDNVSGRGSNEKKETISAMSQLLFSQFFAHPLVVAVYPTGSYEEELKRNVQRAHKKTFYDSVMEYESNKREKNNAIQQLEISRQDQKTQAHQLIYCHQIHRIISGLQEKFVNSLTTLRQSCSTIYEELDRTAILTIYSDERKEILSPVFKRQIVGIFWNLKQRFCTVTSSTLALTCKEVLTDFVSGDEFAKDPTCWLTAVNTKHRMWKDQNIYALLSEDMLWSLWLLRGIPNHPTAQGFIRELNRHFNITIKTIPRYNQLFGVNISSASSLTSHASGIANNDPMPLYHSMLLRATEYIKNEMRFDNDANPRLKQKNSALLTTNLPRPSTNEFVGYKELPTELFTSVITPDQKFFLTYHQRKLKYTSTVKACETCSNGKFSCVPKCQLFLCKKCKHFGHHTNQCHQKV